MNLRKVILLLLLIGSSVYIYADDNEDTKPVSELQVAAIASLASIVVSVITAKITSSYSLRSKPLDAYSSSIQQKRLEKYEKLYIWLSDIGKLIFKNNSGKISERELQSGLHQIQQKVESYDSEVSLYFSAKTGYISFLFREELMKIAICDDFSVYMKDKSLLESFRKNFAARFETSLKLDIGIYEMDQYNKKKSFSYFLYDRKAKRDIAREMKKEM